MGPIWVSVHMQKYTVLIYGLHVDNAELLIFLLVQEEKKKRKGGETPSGKYVKLHVLSSISI